MTLRRTLDATRLNEVANHPDVRPWLGGEGPLDLSGMISDPANFAFENDHGGFVLHRLDADLYEAHSLFLPDGRGAGVRALAEEGFRFLFTATDCMEVVTKVPEGNAAAAALARCVGFVEGFRRGAAWQGPSGPLAVSYQSLTFDRWRSRDPMAAERGHWFHDRLETTKANAGSDLVTHPDDAAHDRAAGAAVLMAMAGRGRKAVWTYNRWALFAGYAPIHLVSEAPLVIDVVDAVVQVAGEDMEVLLCR